MNIKTLTKFVFYLNSCLLLCTNVSFSQQNQFTQDSIRSEELYYTGRAQYRQGDYANSIKNLYKSLDIKIKLYGEQDFRLGRVYNAIGIQYKALGKLNEAIEVYLKTIEIYKEYYNGENARLGTPYTNLGNIYKQKGNFVDALKYHQQALSNYRLTPEKYSFQIEQVKSNIAESYFLIDQFEKSLDFINENINNPDKKILPSIYNLRASIYRSLNNISEAKKNYLLAINATIKVYGEEDYELGFNYINFGDLLISTEDFELAESYLNKAKPIIIGTFGEKGIGPSDLYMTLGDLYSAKTFGSNSLESFRLKKKEYLEKALYQYQEAIIALTDNFVIHDPRANPEIEQCIFEAQCLKALQKKAEAYFKLAEVLGNNVDDKLDYLSCSLNTNIIASDLLNTIRTEVVNEDSKLLISELQNRTFLNSIKIAHELWSLTGNNKYFSTAFQNAERNKAASLMDYLTDQNAKELSLIPDSILLMQENINLQISHINNELFDEIQYNGNDPAKVEAFRAQLFNLEREKARLTRYMESNYEEYYSMKYADDMLQVDDVQNKLLKNEVIVEYVLDISDEDRNGFLYTFLISGNNYKLLKYSVTEQDLADIRKLHEFLSDPNYISITNEKFNNYLSSAYSLYNVLIKPIEEDIVDRNITIIPDGILSYIPFDALLYGQVRTSGINFRNLPYLIKRHSFNYAYSANLYLGDAKKKSAANKLLAFAPTYSKDNSLGDEEFNSLTPLSGIYEEVENISSHVKTKAYIDTSATEENFMKNYQDYDILHLSMHTLLNDSLPMFSKLAFMPSGNESTNMDGWLTTQEIYNLDLNARLAVLSACNTGSGVLKKGEGVISLARGFIYAGCPSIIMTLWEVEDRSGAPILDEFYQLLGNGKRKHQALRMAKLKHIENADPLKAHPHYWLGYVSIGNTDPMYTGNDVYFFLAILLVIVAVISDQLLRNKKARKNRAF